MNDLIHELQLLDVMKFKDANKRFINLIFTDNDKKYIIVSNNIRHNYTVFEYSYEEYSWMGNNTCLNHNNHAMLSAFDVNRKCKICYQEKEIKLINGTGVPLYDNKMEAYFYQYYSNYTNKKEMNKKLRLNHPRDKLIVQQNDKDSNFITHYFIKQSQITSIKLQKHLRWLRYSNIILSINNIELFPEIKNIILSFFIKSII